MTVDSKAALFLFLGQAADRTVMKLEDVVPREVMLLSSEYDLATLVPDKVRSAIYAAQGYKLFFVFEGYLRELIVEVLSKEDEATSWYEKVPVDVRNEIERLEEMEETKSWMSLGSRDKSALMTLPQLLKVIDANWKDGFEELMRDRGLIHEARLLVHLRNTICHMSIISAEELERIKQTMRDWFRAVAP